jgi:hypothetical protein
VVKPWNRGITSGDLWVRLFSLPAILAQGGTNAVRGSELNTVFRKRVQSVQESMGSGKATGLADELVVQLLQADPSGLTGMVAWQQYLEGLLDDALTLGALMSSAGVSQAGRTGDTSEHRDNEDEATFAAAVMIAETFNRHVMPWIIRKNPDLPDLEPGESEVYLWPDDPSDKDEQDVSVDTEGADPLEAMGEQFMRNQANNPTVQLQAEDVATVMDILRGVVSGDTPVRAAKAMLKKHTSYTDDEIKEMVEAAAEMRRELMAELKAEAQKE